MSPRIPTFLVPCLSVLVFALLGGYTLLVVPVGEGPDEDGHIAYALHVLSPGLPDPEQDRVALAPRPPLYYGLGAAAAGLLGSSPGDVRAEKPDIVMRPVALPGSYRTELQYHAAPGRGEPTLSPAYAMRLVSLVFGILAVVGLYLGASWSFGKDRRAVRATVGWALLPGVVFSAAVVSNDMAAAAFTTLIYALYMRTLSGRFLTEAWHGLILGGLLGAGVLTQASGLIPVVLFPLVGVLAAVRPWRKAVVRSSVVALVTLGLVGVGGWFFLADPVNQGEVFLLGFQEAGRPRAALPFPPDGNYLGHVVTRLWRGYLGDLGCQEIELSRPLILFFLALGGAALGGVVLLVRDHVLRLRRSHRPEVQARNGPFVLSEPGPLQAEVGSDVAGAAEPPILGGRGLVFCLVAVAVTFGLLVRWSFLMYGPNGRCLHVVLLPVSLLCVAGLRRLVGSEGFKVAAPVLALGPLLATVYTVFFDVLPHFHTPWSKWTRGEVIAYDDAGNPRAESHRIKGPGPGGHFEPWGTYSTARVPEMNLAWGIPEVKFRYEDLDPRLPYQVRLTYYGGREPGKFGHVSYQELHAGTHKLHGPMPLTFRPRELSYSIPRGAVTAEGRLELTFRSLHGAVAGVAEVWLERAWVTLKAAEVMPDPPRPGERIQARIRLENRDPVQVHRAELYLRVRTAGGRIHTLVGQKTVSPVQHGRPWQGGLVAGLPEGITPVEFWIGVRRVDRGPWAVFKGATNLGPEGCKRGDLEARDLHVAALEKGRTGCVVRAPLAGMPAGPCRVRVRYRAGKPGWVRLLTRAGVVAGRFPLPETDGKYRDTERSGLAAGTGVLALEVTFPRACEAAVDEILVWTEGNDRDFHDYPIGQRE